MEYGDRFHVHSNPAAKAITMKDKDSQFNDKFFDFKNFVTEEGKIVSIKLPKGFPNLKENDFKNFPAEDIPYILQEVANNSYNKGEREESALFTVAAIWAGNKDHNFINELEDHHPGIVEDIGLINNLDQLQKILWRLSATATSANE